MAIYREDIANVELSSGQIFRSFMNHTIGSGDELANRFGVRVFRNGEPENIGGTCMGLFIRADGTTVTISSGVVSGNEAYVTLPEACYAVEGQFSLAIKCQGSGVTGTLRIVDGVVSRTSTSAAVDPGTVIPSIENLIDAIDEAVASIPADYSSLWESLAPEFSTSTSYAVGQYVTYDGGLYKFVTEHTAGSWNSAHVTEATLGGGISAVKSTTSLDINSVAKVADQLYENKRTATVEAVRYQYNNIDYEFAAGKQYKIKITRNETAPEDILISSANDGTYVDVYIAKIFEGSNSISFGYVPSANASNLRIQYAETKNGITYTAEIEKAAEVTFTKRALTKLTGTPKYGLMQNGQYIGEEDSNYYQTLWFDVTDINSVTIDYDTSYYHDVYAVIGQNGETIDYLLSTENAHASLTVQLRADAKYIVLSANNEAKLQYSRVTAEKRLKSANLLGKKVVWFGTSIPAGGKYGYGDINSYPMRLGAMTGATVYNEAVGSSTVHCRRLNYVSQANPYGFIEPFDAVSRSLSNTLEMAEWIIDHFTDFRNAPPSLSEDDKAFIRSCSYETKLDKYLTPETEPDLWVFDHGHNDYLGTETDYSESEPFSTFTFQGAMNFLINRIKQFNPHAKIIIVGDYDAQRYPAITTYQKAVADRWEFPFFRLFEEMGWSDKTISTTGFWRNGMWQTKGGTEHEMSYINVWCADDLHPHSDATGRALDYYARVLFKYFCSIEFGNKY